MARYTALLTLDVEDWEHANFAQLESRTGEVSRTRAERSYSMEANTDRWIELLEARGARSTCFVLGEFARRYPEAVRKLARAGHELATHGATHDLVYRMSREQFREFLKKGIGDLADVTGKSPLGFRAPSWSVDSRTPWVFEELDRQGIRYDSSVFPVKTPLFGQGGGKLEEHWEGRILRIPVTVLTLGPVRLPFSTGAFFRLAPLPVILYGLRKASRRRLPAMVVLHPRELDPAHPRLPLSGWEGKVHYARLSTTVPKLQAILEAFEWRSIAEVYGPKLDTPGAPLDN